MIQSYQHILFHIVAYYTVWFSCMLNAAAERAWLAVLIALTVFCIQLFWQYRVVHKTAGLWRVILVLTFAGAIVDSAMVWFGLIDYRDNLFAPFFCPPWIIVLWPVFAVVVYACLQWLWSRPILTGLLAFFGFYLAYGAGALLGAATLNIGQWSAIILSVIWLLLLPGLFQYFQQQEMIQ